MAKAYSVFNRLSGRRDDSATIVIYTQKAATGAGEAALNSFLTTHYTDISALLLKAQNLQ
jgi:hypothetical protein